MEPPVRPGHRFLPPCRDPGARCRWGPGLLRLPGGLGFSVWGLGFSSESFFSGALHVTVRVLQRFLKNAVKLQGLGQVLSRVFFYKDKFEAFFGCIYLRFGLSEFGGSGSCVSGLGLRVKRLFNTRRIQL